MLKKILAVWLLFHCVFAFAATKEDISKLTQQWAVAIASGDPQKVVALYDPHALMFPTLQNRNSTQAERLKYFTNLLHRPNFKVDFIWQQPRLYQNVALNSGYYNFSFTDKGKTVKIPARFTFVYLFEQDKGWLIIEHHSSDLPEEHIVL